MNWFTIFEYEKIDKNLKLVAKDTYDIPVFLNNP